MVGTISIIVANKYVKGINKSKSKQKQTLYIYMYDKTEQNIRLHK